MSDEEMGGAPDQHVQQRRIQLRDAGVSTHYASFFTVTAGQDAILLSFGNQLGAEAIQIEDKVVLSPRNAKRMAISLGQVIRRYEQQQGEIDINVAPPAGAADQQHSGQGGRERS